MRIKIYPDNPNQDRVDQIVDILRAGGVVIIPSGAGYAFACDAFDSRAVDRICQLKWEEPEKKLLSVMCSDISQASTVCRISDFAYQYIRDHEGIYTFILPSAGKLPKAFKARKEIGLKLVMHPIPLLLIDELGSPLMVGSLKEIEGEDVEFISDPELVDEKYHGQVDAVVDGGIAERSPSTIISLLDDEAVLIRQGAGGV